MTQLAELAASRRIRTTSGQAELGACWTPATRSVRASRCTFLTRAIRLSSRWRTIREGTLRCGVACPFFFIFSRDSRMAQRTAVLQMDLFWSSMIGNINVDKKNKGSVTLDYDMCVDLMLMIKNGNTNAASRNLYGCGTYGGWLPYGGNSGIYNSAATRNSVVSFLFVLSRQASDTTKMLTPCSFKAFVLW